MTPDNGPSHETATTRPNRLAWPLAIIVLGCMLYLPGLRWGLPGMVSWSQDTIAANRTIGAVHSWPDAWKGRYPPLHYLVLRAAYEPVLGSWERAGECRFDPESPVPILQPPHPPKIGLLALIARGVSVAMAIAAGLGVYCAARLLTGDPIAAGVSAVTLLIGAAFVYFAHLGNVDVPSVCWFAWSLYFFARVARAGHWRGCLLLGLFGAAAISTKDAVAGAFPGMALVLLIAEARRLPVDQPMAHKAAIALLRPKWLIGLAAFALPYLYLNGVFHDSDAFLTRMRYWLDASGDTLHAKQHRYGNQLLLAWATVVYAAGAVGWPMLGAMAVAIWHTIRRRSWLAVMMLVPAVSYYLIVIVRIDFVYSRFLFPPLALISILLGVAAADLWRARQLPPVLRLGVPVLVGALSLGYAVGVDLDMVQDSRYAAEAWFTENVEPPSSIGAFPMDDRTPLKAQYLPRVVEMGYATYPVAMRHESFERPQPEYLMLTSYNFEDFGAEQRACMKDLMQGKLGYRPAATFQARYLGATPSWLTIASIGAPRPGKISPRLIVLKRTDSGVR